MCKYTKEQHGRKQRWSVSSGAMRSSSRIQDSCTAIITSDDSVKTGGRCRTDAHSSSHSATQPTALKDEENRDSKRYTLPRGFTQVLIDKKQKLGSQAGLPLTDSSRAPLGGMALDERNKTSVARRLRDMQHSPGVIDPRARSAVWVKEWDLLMVIALLFTAIITPVEVAFLDEGEKLTPLWWINRIVDVVFVVDIVITFNMGARVASHRRRIAAASPPHRHRIAIASPCLTSPCLASRLA